jgi:hypothetical protein
MVNGRARPSVEPGANTGTIHHCFNYCRYRSRNDHAVPKVTARAAQGCRGRWGRCGLWVAAIAAWCVIAPLMTQAASVSDKDLLVLGRAASFLLPPPVNGDVVAIAYAESDAASRQDAEAIAALIGDGLRVGDAVLRAKLVPVGALGTEHCALVIAAAGANGPQLSAASHAVHALCVTTELAAVQAGLCALGIRSAPRVEILLNHTALTATGIEFSAAFRMMIHEI